MADLIAILILVLSAPLALCVGVLWVLLRPVRVAYSATRLAPPSTLIEERLSAEDLASRRADEFLADALATQARESGHTIYQVGTCANCGERCHTATVYCDPECRADHEERLRVLARQGVQRPARGGA